MQTISLLKRTLLITCTILLIIFPQTGSSQSNNKEPRYKEGQVWSYKTRKNEEQSTLTILKIEADSKIGNIIHISVTGLKMKNPDSEDTPIDTIGHMPFAEKAINKSVVSLVKENADIPDYSEAYDEWRRAFDNKIASVYKVAVAEAVKKAEKKLNNPRR